MPPRMPEGFDIDSPARFVAGMRRAEWFEHCLENEERRLRIQARLDQWEAQEREKRAKAVKRAEARARKWFEDLPSPAALDAARAATQERLDRLALVAVIAYVEMLDAALADPDAPSNADLLAMFRLGVRHFGWLPPALEQRA